MSEPIEHPSIPIDRQCKVVAYHELGIWAFEKAVGILSHPNKDNSKGKKAHSLLNAEFDHEFECYKWTDNSNREQNLFLCHRLDSPTSGVILGVSDHSLAKTIRRTFAERKVRKTYYAVVHAKGKCREGLWRDHLVENRSRGKLRVGKGKQGFVALTLASTLRAKAGLYGLSLLRLEPKTGRTHQLRVQCALRETPIIGDRTYGNFSLNRKIGRAAKVDRLCLHAGEIELQIQLGNRSVSFFAESPLPRSFGKLLA